VYTDLKGQISFENHEPNGASVRVTFTIPHEGGQSISIDNAPEFSE